MKEERMKEEEKELKAKQEKDHGNGGGGTVIRTRLYAWDCKKTTITKNITK